MKINGKEFRPRFLTPDERRRLDSWLRSIVRGAMELRFESELTKAMEIPAVLRELLCLITDCSPEDAEVTVNEGNARAWAETISHHFVLKPIVFSGTAEEQRTALESHLQKVSHAVQP